MMIYSEEYYLSAGEGNAQQELSLTRLTDILIDIATSHANSLGIGNPVMADRNAGWVLARLTIEMDSYPKVNQYYKVETWVESWNRHFSERAFRISDKEGNVFGFARSVWMVMTTDTHENYGLSHLRLPENAIVAGKCPIERQEKHRPIMRQGTPAAKAALEATRSDDYYRFKYCDIDFYRHVNTVRYITLLLNQYSMQDMDSNRVGRIELSFMHEGLYGMEIAIRCAATSPRHDSFLLQDTASEKPLLFARIRLDAREDRLSKSALSM